MSKLVDELRKLSDLKKEGFLTEEEFSQAKTLILADRVEVESSASTNRHSETDVDNNIQQNDEFAEWHSQVSNSQDSGGGTLTKGVGSQDTFDLSRGFSLDPAYKYIKNPSKSYVKNIDEFAEWHSQVSNSQDSGGGTLTKAEDNQFKEKVDRAYAYIPQKDRINKNSSELPQVDENLYREDSYLEGTVEKINNTGLKSYKFDAEDLI